MGFGMWGSENEDYPAKEWKMHLRFLACRWLLRRFKSACYILCMYLCSSGLYYLPIHIFLFFPAILGALMLTFSFITKNSLFKI